MRARFLAACALSAGALLLAACGDDDDSTTTSAATDTATTATATEAATAPEKPDFDIPEGDPPQELVVEDLEEGTGPGAKPGDTIVVHYAGKSFSTGEEFDNSYDRGQPFPLELGAGQVIGGWDEGLVGMKAGGRRMLVIPPDLAYGPEGSPPAIGPNETLVFVVDMVDIQ